MNRLRYTISTLLLLVAVFSILLGWGIPAWRRAVQQRNLVQEIIIDGGYDEPNYDSITYDYEFSRDGTRFLPDARPGWLGRNIDVDLFHDVVAVDISFGGPRRPGILHDIAQLRNLENLFLPTGGQSDLDLGPLQDMMQLKVLTDLPPEGLQHIVNCRHLSDLTVGSNVSDSDYRISPSQKSCLSSLTSLRSLSISLDGSDLDALTGMKNLATLDLQNCNLGNSSFVNLKELPNLTTLNLSDAQVSDENLEHLRHCSRLKVLLLQNASLTDRGTRYISAIESLEVLDLANTAITDAALMNFTDMPRLKTLQITNCSSITEKGEQSFRKISPNVRVTSSFTQ